MCKESLFTKNFHHRVIVSVASKWPEKSAKASLETNFGWTRKRQSNVSKMINIMDIVLSFPLALGAGLCVAGAKCHININPTYK